jgi:predicted phage terminase large subunit-like protein
LERGGFEHLNLPAIAERDDAIQIGRELFKNRQSGEVLFPEKQPLETLERMRLELGPVAFSAQYQQNPTVPGGNRIRWEWWGTYEPPADRRDYSHVVQSWDTGLSAEPTSDPSVCTTWGFREGRWYLLDLFRERLDYGPLRSEVLRLMSRWDCDRVIIESVGSGKILYRELVREYGVCDMLSPYVPVVDKRTRLETQMAKLETGNFMLPREAPWLEEFRRECQAFPNGRHDDQVDSLTQFLDWLGHRRGLGFMRGRWRR